MRHSSEIPEEANAVHSPGNEYFTIKLLDEHIFPGLLAKLHVCDRQLGQLPHQPSCSAGQDGAPCHLVLSPH